MNWRLVKKITKTPFFRYASYVVIGVPLLAEVFNALHPFYPAARFPHLLIFGFIAGVMFVFSEVLCHLFCPEKVRRYETESDYVTAHQKEYESAQFHQRLHVVLPQLEESEEDDRDDLKRLVSTGDTPNLNRKLDVLYPIAVARFLRKDYQRNTKHNIALAWVAFVLYATGILFAGFVMYGRLAAVWQAGRG